MEIFHYEELRILIEFFCGLIVFMFSIKFLSTTMENNLNNKFKNIFNKLTYNKILSLILGILITLLFQSSSLVIVIIITLVHSRVLNIKKAIPIILGANIGTTFTAQITAFDIEKLLPVIILIALILYLYGMNSKHRLIATFILSISLIFIGIKLMGSSIYEITNSTYILKNIAYIYDSKIKSIFFGAFFSALIHSSSTSVVLLQLISKTGIIPLLSSIYILFGLNIGTSIDAIIAGITTNTYGKKIALFQLSFNIFGSIIFFFLGDILENVVVLISPNNIARQIANAHTIFNITTVLLIFPFTYNIAQLLDKKNN